MAINGVRIMCRSIDAVDRRHAVHHHHRRAQQRSFYRSSSARHDRAISGSQRVVCRILHALDRNVRPRIPREEFRTQPMRRRMHELDVPRLRNPFARLDHPCVILRNLVRPAARQNCHDRPARIQSLLRRKFRARHRGPHRIHQRMPHKIHRYACIPVNLFFERENHHHPLHQPLHHPHAPRAPSPHLRPNEISHWNIYLLQPPRHAQVRSRRIHQHSQRRAALRRFARQPILHSNHRGDFVQHFSDAHHRHFVIIRDQLHARFAHSRSTHPKKLRARPRPQRRRQPRRVHITRRFARGD